MSNELNKTHWYDGWFYDSFIAPNQDRLFSLIKEIIKPDSSVIDVGCGTGRLSFFIADKVSKVAGIDLSQKNIQKANDNLSKNPNKKISFVHTDISSMISKNEKFDYAVMTYVIHEVNEEKRVELLQQLSQVANKIIIGDYLVPKPDGFWSKLNEVVEFLAGNEHYTNYKNYVRNGGLKYLAEKADLKIIREIKNKPSTSHLVILNK
ncbi:class I SAM-dependent methyltransferase [Stygiobacter electus]|uniref:Class I SAM-dependent methyltransferase n=1 Tax=Stygiobacter electus TaxID=3032292 RepID=A0AAE3TFB5_9BACT|nr:class I SAM-dependent methyltransferase [Stygiobacter electus]MDF1613248.1 class I SAM-dependent methyltransferase [Stygiobacter electus]